MKIGVFAQLIFLFFVVDDNDLNVARRLYIVSVAVQLIAETTAALQLLYSRRFWSEVLVSSQLQSSNEMRLVKVPFVHLQHMHAVSFSHPSFPHTPSDVVSTWAASSGSTSGPAEEPILSFFLSFSPSAAPLTFPSASSAPLQLLPPTSEQLREE